MALCNWSNEAYFADLLCTDKRAHHALELLVDDLHADKEKTIYAFMCHSGSEDFLWGLVHLLGSDFPRVAGNAAYIIGTLAESEVGCCRIMTLARDHSNNNGNILRDLTRMLTFTDAESVMNAAGTMGTLAESHEGRVWMLSEPCVHDMIQHITALLNNDNLWTASNAALVLARLCISEVGCNCILNHWQAQSILTQLLHALGVDEAVRETALRPQLCPTNLQLAQPLFLRRGMNAAFAIGRLCDMDTGRQQLLALQDSEKMISSLAKMLSCEDAGASKNSCFALSCLATSLEGHSRLLQNIHSEDVLDTLALLLSDPDSETGWFAAMTLRTLASQPKGCFRLRANSQVVSALKVIQEQADINPDLREEVVMTLEILRCLQQPSPPLVQVQGPDQIIVTWQALTTKSGLTIQYQLYEGDSCVYAGPGYEYQARDLQPSAQYTYKLRAYTEGDLSSFSESVTVTTEEDLPGPPSDLRILACTASQLKVAWRPPESCRGVIRGYYVYLGGSMVEHTTELTAIISGLVPNTVCHVQVCAATAKGKGERSAVTGTTAELGAHAPSKPHVQVIGRNEMHITWEPPEVPLGRISRYDLSMNGKGVYSGLEQSFSALRLSPDTEYSFVVTLLTSEGKFESKPTKKRTAKDEYDASRPPLYQPPSKKETEDDGKPAASSKKHRSVLKKVRSPTGSRKVPRHRVKRTKSSFVPVPIHFQNQGRSAVLTAHGSKWKLAEEGQRCCNEVDPLKSGNDLICPQRCTGVVATEQGLEEREEGKQTAPQVFLNPQRTKNTSKGSCSSRRHSTSSAGSYKSAPCQPHSEHAGSGVKAAFPVTISYISLQDADLEMDPVSSDIIHRKNHSRSPAVTDSSSCVAIHLNRSKTSFLTPKPVPHSRLSRQDTELLSKTAPRYPNNMEAQQHWRQLAGDRVGEQLSLPKPAIPTQSYLQGVKSISSGSYDNQHLLQSQPHYRDKVTTDSYRKPASMHHSKAQYSIMPVQLMGGSGGPLVPAGRESLLAQQQSHNKFVPMQLRTQPSHLPASQLQRVNTSLLPPTASLAKRMESASQSQIQANFKTRSSTQVK